MWNKNVPVVPCPSLSAPSSSPDITVAICFNPAVAGRLGEGGKDKPAIVIHIQWTLALGVGLRATPRAIAGPLWACWAGTKGPYQCLWLMGAEAGGGARCQKLLPALEFSKYVGMGWGWETAKDLCSCSL